MSATQEQLWLDRIAAALVAEGVTTGNRLMLDGAKATRRAAALEIRGGALPLMSSPLRDTLCARADHDPPPEGIETIVFPEAPAGWLDEQKRPGQRRDGRRR